MGKTEVTGKQIKDSSVDLTVDITGVLPVANGGSGSNTIALNNVVLGNGNGAVQTVAPGASGNVLRSNGTTWASSSLAQSDVSGLTTALSGKEPIINGGSTGQYWRGDKTWQTLDKTAVGLENVDNTSDANKPISTSTQTALNSKESTANKGVANGYASLDGGGKVPITQLPSSIMEYQGVYNATTNSPSLIDGTGNTGDVYRVSVAGTRNFGSGSITLRVGDYVIYNGSVWQKSATTDAVASVAGKTGDVTLDAADIATGTFALSKLTTTGSASSSTFLRGDGAWSAPGGITRSVQTINSPTTLAAASNTDYVYFLSKGTDQTTVSMLHMENSSSDTGSGGVTWTAGGFGTGATVAKFGTYGMTAGGRISTTANSSALAFGTNNFTIEFWLYADGGTNVAERGVYEGRTSSTDTAIAISYSSAWVVQFYAGNTVRISGGNMSGGGWFHIAVSRSGSSTRMFINGTQVGSTYTDSNNYTTKSATQLGGSTIIGNMPSGAIDEFRVSNVARYTANFTAPTAAFNEFVFGTPTLPTAVGNTNHYTLKNISNSSITPTTTSSQTIDGTTPAAITSGSTSRLVSDGSNWRTV